MPRKTSYDELYTTLGALLLQVTGRAWWRKASIQSRPTTPYATIYLTTGRGLENDNVENTLLAEPTLTGEIYRQTPWGTTLLECRIEFLKSATGNTASDAATRFRNALRLEARYFDLWHIMGLVGGVDQTDISAIFRADTEPRVELRFQLYANIADPAPLTGQDIYDIESQTVEVTHVRVDGVETKVDVDVTDPDPTPVPD